MCVYGKVKIQGGMACRRRERQFPRAGAPWETWWTPAVSVSHASICVCVSKSFLVTELAHGLYDPAQWAGLLHHRQPPTARINTHTHTFLCVYSVGIRMPLFYKTCTPSHDPTSVFVNSLHSSTLLAQKVHLNLIYPFMLTITHILPWWWVSWTHCSFYFPWTHCGGANLTSLMKGGPPKLSQTDIFAHFQPSFFELGHKLLFLFVWTNSRNRWSYEGVYVGNLRLSPKCPLCRI